MLHMAQCGSYLRTNRLARQAYEFRYHSPCDLELGVGPKRLNEDVALLLACQSFGDTSHSLFASRL